MILEAIVIDQLDPFRPPGIRFSMTRDVSIPNHVGRVGGCVSGPRSDICVSADPAVGVQVVDEAGPGLGHQVAQIRVALAFVLERVGRVAQT